MTILSIILYNYDIAARKGDDVNLLYVIEETLRTMNNDTLLKNNTPYVSVISRDEWKNRRDQFDMGIEIDPGELSDIVTTKAEANYDSVTGTFSIPNRKDFTQKDTAFAFALDEKGIVFIDDSGTALKITTQIQNTKKWRVPCLERFIYDFIDQLISGDQQLMSRYEWELYALERAITREQDSVSIDRVNDIRGDVRDLHNHYEQLLDMAEVFTENENNFFSKENIRYFRLLTDRIERLLDTSAAISDYTMQIRDLYKMHLDIKQNNIMTILTAVTTIFMPLTLIVGWYGMNFQYMPELSYKWSYPILSVISVLIVVVNVIVFKKKKWM